MAFGDESRFLVSKGFITQEQWDQARMFGGDPFERLLEQGILNERVLYQARAVTLGMAFADLDLAPPDPAARKSLSAELDRELRVLPVKRDGNTLWLAMEEPDPDRIERVKRETGLRVIPVLCVPAALDDALSRLT
jgi:type IV pilus assembly protein PilB